MVRKGSKISEAKKKGKSERRRLIKRKYASSSKNIASSISRERRRQCNKEQISQNVLNEVAGGNLCTDFTRRISDRKYIEGNVKYLRNELNSYNCRDDLVQLFGKKLESLAWYKCALCHTRQIQFSQKCWCSKPYIMRSRVFSVGSCPTVLSELTLVEQLLIARVHPVVQVYRLIGGQTGYSSHVINFFQDVKEVAKVLPHTVSNLKGIVNVCYDKLKFHKDFKIRKQKVLDALLFLKEKNKYYYDIVIDSAAVASLPCDDFFHGNRSDMEDLVDDAPCQVEVISTAVPSTGFFHPEDKLKHSMNWPHINTDAVKELTRPYIAQAFPVLFPYSEGDLHEVRDKNLTPRIYFQYLMDFEDGRFSSHKIFPYFGLNTVMRWECLSKGTIYIKDHPNLKKMNIEILKDIMKKNPDYMKDILVYGSNIRGTREFWSSRSNELTALCDFLGLPTIFFTASAADMRWPRLKELICEHQGLSAVDEKSFF
ncbi:Bifunctional lycopene cyclase/phytoene synthase [Frankliniella fusca]|uniref:Bifunctional lycopene cyclase/phytoene synthase n=1 Tax=Frankliniella fusca TaxID=407009 RepID=A0AAE1LRI4_9NEOP|nr:Bifunctional lycopene cyclase/phytoene synthase [Frankliniella fusca]